MRVNVPVYQITFKYVNENSNCFKLSKSFNRQLSHLRKKLSVGWPYIPWQPLQGGRSPKCHCWGHLIPGNYVTWRDESKLCTWTLSKMMCDRQVLWNRSAGTPSASHSTSLSAVFHWKQKDISEVTIADITPFVYYNTHLALLMVLSLY